MQETLIIIVLVIVLLAVYLVVPHLILARTVPVVIDILRRANAVGIENARSTHELGLAEKPLIERALHKKDHKPRALQALLTLGVVKLDDSGQVYLCEQGLAKTRWANL